MKNNRTLFHELLALDCIYNVLPYSDRIYLHKCIAGKTEEEEEGSEKLSDLYEIMKIHRFKAPFMKYPEWHPDQIYFETAAGQLAPLNQYQDHHPGLTEKIRQTFNK